jgi:hypothetical protein
MRRGIVVIDGIGLENLAQVGFAKDDDVIQALSGGSSRSASPHAHSARVTAAQSGDPGCPSPQDAE